MSDCDHDFWPLGVLVDGKSAAYCRTCLALRWLNAAAWKANDERRRQRRAIAGGTDA